MNDERSHAMHEHEATVHDIARATREGEMTSEALGKILEGRHGAVNCYPGQPTHTCYPIAYFIALEGRMGHKFQIELARAEWGADRPARGWLRRRLPFWDIQTSVYEEPPFTFAYMLEQLVRHVQGSCAGTTREVVPITDSWNPEAFERWRSNLEAIRQKTSLAIYLIGEGSLCTRLV